jgi:hypothetical protein
MYRVETVGEDIDAAIEALPEDLLAAFAELRVALEVSPRTVGRPYVAANPSGSRTASFGPGDRGMVLYVVQEREQVVAIWQVTALADLD